MPDHVQHDARRRRARSTSSPRELQDARSVLFLGRHAGFPVALEGALKLKELAYIHAEGFAAGELKHGPIALIEEGMPVFCVVPPPGRDFLHDKMVSGIQEIRARGARTIVVAEEGDDAVDAVRRRADPDPTVLDAAAAAGGRGAAAAVRLRAGDRQGPRRRPAAQPRQVRHRRVDRRDVAVIVGVGVDVVRHRAGSRRRCDVPPTLRRAAVHRRRARAGRSPRWPPGSPPRRRWPRRSARPPGWRWHDAEVVSEAGRPPVAGRCAARSLRRGRRRSASTHGAPVAVPRRRDRDRPFVVLEERARR